jgi:hypothetical protein
MAGLSSRFAIDVLSITSIIAYLSHGPAVIERFNVILSILSGSQLSSAAKAHLL